jgi:Flp pilus assembly protein TadG
MLPPLIQTARRGAVRSDERGFTMAMVAVSLLAIISMAVLSIDIGTLYQAKAEAQRAADAAALAAARVISISGITGDPTNKDGGWINVCGGSGSAATLAAIAVAQQNLIAGRAASKINVNYGTRSAPASNGDCTGLGSAFPVNPIISVYVQQATLPTFFSHIFSLVAGGTTSNSGASATATAEVFNSSGSGSAPFSNMIPVQPRCVKPWIIPNIDPGNGGVAFVDPASGVINHPGVSQLGSGIIGETFKINADCKPGVANCEIVPGNILYNPPQFGGLLLPGALGYVPALISTNPPGAIPSCSPALAAGYQAAIAGCDQTTYACGVVNGTSADLTENPANPTAVGGDTAAATECLTGQNSGGADALGGAYPFQIQAGLSNPLVKAGVVFNNDIITTSNSIVTIPIADFGGVPMTGLQPQVTIVGFLQAFINVIDGSGNIQITVMNVSGCSNTASNPPVNGTSPVPVRLITSP